MCCCFRPEAATLGRREAASAGPWDRAAPSLARSLAHSSRPGAHSPRLPAASQPPGPRRRRVPVPHVHLPQRARHSAPGALGARIPLANRPDLPTPKTTRCCQPVFYLESPKSENPQPGGVPRSQAPLNVSPPNHRDPTGVCLARDLRALPNAPVLKLPGTQQCTLPLGAPQPRSEATAPSCSPGESLPTPGRRAPSTHLAPQKRLGRAARAARARRARRRGGQKRPSQHLVRNPGPGPSPTLASSPRRRSRRRRREVKWGWNGAAPPLPPPPGVRS